MPAITRAEFRRALGRLSTAGFVAFVADLWAARGYDTDVDGTTVLVRAGGEPTTIRVCHDGSLLGRLRAALGARGVEDADLVVTSAPADRVDPGTDIEVIGAGDLHGMALYGIDRDACTTLFDDHLDRSPTVQSRGSRVTVRAVVFGTATAVAVLLVVVAATAGPFGPATPEPDTKSVATTARPAAAFGTGTAGTATVSRPTATARPTTTPQRAKAVDLAYAHADILQGMSFAVSINRTYRHPDGTVIERNELDAAFAANRTRYLVTLSQQRADLSNASAELWTGDGFRVFRKLTVANETSYELLRDSEGNLVSSSEALPFDPVYAEGLPGLLAAVESANVSPMDPTALADDPEGNPTTVAGIVERGHPGDTVVFRVEANLSDEVVSRLDDFGEVENATMSAIVDSEGRFYRYTVVYDTPFWNRSVRVTRTVRYTGVGNTTVERPEWYDEARRAVQSVSGSPALPRAQSSSPHM